MNGLNFHHLNSIFVCLEIIDELQVIVRAFVCAIFINFLSLFDSRRKYSISKNLECPLVCIDK
jgi:hypothetical protein